MVWNYEIIYSTSHPPPAVAKWSNMKHYVWFAFQFNFFGWWSQAWTIHPWSMAIHCGRFALLLAVVLFSGRWPGRRLLLRGSVFFWIFGLAGFWPSNGFVASLTRSCLAWSTTFRVVSDQFQRSSAKRWAEPMDFPLDEETIRASSLHQLLWLLSLISAELALRQRRGRFHDRPGPLDQPDRHHRIRGQGPYQREPRDWRDGVPGQGSLVPWQWLRQAVAADKNVRRSACCDVQLKGCCLSSCSWKDAVSAVEEQ